MEDTAVSTPHSSHSTAGLLGLVCGLGLALLGAPGCAAIDSESAESTSVIEVCDVIIEGRAWSLDEACESCECPTCDASDDAYRAAYEQEFGQPPAGGQGLTAPEYDPIVPDDVNAQCRRVSQMTYTETFNCRDYTTWFLICLHDRGYTGSGASMRCKNCDNDLGHNGNGTVGHRIPLVERDMGDGTTLFCPVEPGWGSSNGIVTSCCRAFRSDAVECANSKWCSGRWPNLTRPAPRYAGCEPAGYTFRDCKSCLDEECTPEERAQVCEIINHADDAAACEDGQIGVDCIE